MASLMQVLSMEISFENSGSTEFSQECHCAHRGKAETAAQEPARRRRRKRKGWYNSKALLHGLSSASYQHWLPTQCKGVFSFPPSSTLTQQSRIYICEVIALISCIFRNQRILGIKGFVFVFDWLSLLGFQFSLLLGVCLFFFFYWPWNYYRNKYGLEEFNSLWFMSSVQGKSWKRNQ